MTLTEFLLARIAEDEAMAKASNATGWAPGTDGLYWDAEFGGEICIDPARVLAECEAKRQIVEDLTPHDGADGRYDFGVTGWGVMRLLALPYADHPDYREEWKP